MAKAKTKSKPRNLGTATGVAEARERKAPAPPAPDAGKGETFMHKQREDDALEAKLGEAAKEIKACHGLSREAHMRLGAARLATSTHEAIRHDLERVVQLAVDMGETAENALTLLDR